MNTALGQAYDAWLDRGLEDHCEEEMATQARLSAALDAFWDTGFLPLEGDLSDVEVALLEELPTALVDLVKAPTQTLRLELANALVARYEALAEEMIAGQLERLGEEDIDPEPADPWD